MAATIRAQFHDPAGGAFYQTSNDHEQLVARRKDFVDSATPSGNSLAAELLLRLAVLTGRPEYADEAAEVMRLLSEAMGAQPGAFGRLLAALDLYLHPGREVAIIGEPADPRTQALLAEIRRRYLPDMVTALAPSGDAAAQLAEIIPLLADRGQVNGLPTAYVCRNFACRLPVTEPEHLAEQLDESI